jgi:LPS-assembly protein
MHNSRLTPLVLSLLALFAHSAHADDSDDAVALKPQPSLLSGLPSDEATPVFISADRLQGHQDAEFEAHGNVELRKRGQAVFAEHLIYNRTEDEVWAEDRVRVEQGKDMMRGPELRMKLERREGYMRAPDFWLGGQQAHGDAETLLFQGKDKYGLVRTRYTTCEPGSEDWFVRAGELEIDRTTQIGTAHHARVEFMGVPVLYSPWMTFSLSNQRKSGLLTPSFGSTSNSGFAVTLPFYWNIAPNRDATITPRILTKRGVLLLNEFRYLEPNYSGQADLDYLPDDRVAGASRHAFTLRHLQNFGSGWSGALHLQQVSDDAYYRDLGTQISATSRVNLPREGTLSYAAPGLGFSARVQRFQTLQDPLAPIVPPYHRTPQLMLTAAKPNVYSTNLALASEYVDFRHPTLINGQRFMLNPSASLPLTTIFGYVTPKIGLHHTRYALGENNASGFPDATRNVPILSVDSGVFFERDLEARGKTYVQTLEPRLYYLYVPYRKQDQLPVFDSGELDLSYAQLFTENRFSGSDRINDANQVTAALTSRLLDPTSGQAYLTAAIGQRYYFKEQEVTLTSPARTDKTSDILAVASGRFVPGWTLDAGWQYNPNREQTEKFNLGTRYQPQPGKTLNFSYRYTRASLKQIDVSTQWPVYGYWQALARWNYSLLDSKILEGLAGLEYNGGCWAARVVAHRFATATGEVSNSLFVQLELNGVSRIGSNPIDVLKLNISGYAKSSDQPHEARSTEVPPR